MKNYDHIVIGFGKGGKTLAGALASEGQTETSTGEIGEAYEFYI